MDGPASIAHRLTGGMFKRRRQHDATPVEREFVAEFRGRIEAAENYLRDFHRAWFVNIAAAIGTRPGIAQAIAKMLGLTRPIPRQRVQHHTNIIGGACRRLVGYIARSNPKLEIVAADLDDPFQVDEARGAEKWLDENRRLDDGDRKDLRWIEWAVYTGFGVKKAAWDPHAGPRVSAVDPDTGMPLEDDLGQEIVDKYGRPLKYTAGMPSTFVVPTFHWIYGIEARAQDEMTWCGEKSWMSFRDIDAFLGPGSCKKLSLSPEPLAAGEFGYHEREVQAQISPHVGARSLAGNHEERGCVVAMVYVAPYVLDADTFGDEIYENGSFVMMAQDRLLTTIEPNVLLELEGVNPRLDWHPYSFVPLYTVPGRLLAQGLPDNLHSIQDGLNFVISRSREAQRMMGSPKWFLPLQSVQNEKELDNEVGSKVKFNPLFGPPMAWTPPAMPAYIFNLVGLFEAHGNRVAAQPPVIQGQADGQVRSGPAINSLQEQAMTEFTPILVEADLAKARHARQLLMREMQFGLVERVVKWPNESSWEQRRFFAKNLDPSFSVIAVPGTSMPFSSQAAMTEMDRAIAWGIYQPQMNPQHAELIARTMRWKVPPAMPGNEEENLRRARYENAAITAGDDPVIYAVYNHRVHINEHVRFMTSERFRQMAEKDPTLLARFNMHLGRHYGFLQLEAQGFLFPQPVPPIADLQAQSGSPAGQGGPGEESGSSGAGGSGQSGGGANPRAGGAGTGVQFGFARAGSGLPPGGGGGIQGLGGIGKVPQMAQLGS